MDSEKNPNNNWWRSGLLLFARLSVWIGGPVIVAVVVGRYLDKIFNSAPWLFLLTIAFSFIFSIFKIVKIGLKEMDKK